MPRVQTSPADESKADAPPAKGSVMRMTVYFHQEEWDGLRDQAAKDDTTMATLVRKAVRGHLGLD